MVSTCKNNCNSPQILIYVLFISSIAFKTFKVEHILSITFKAMLKNHNINLSNMHNMQLKERTNEELNRNSEE